VQYATVRFYTDGPSAPFCSQRVELFPADLSLRQRRLYCGTLGFFSFGALLSFSIGRSFGFTSCVRFFGGP
jgi:hypothetical protein